MARREAFIVWFRVWPDVDLVQIIEDRGLVKQDIAGLAGLAPPSFSEVIRGRKSCRPGAAYAIVEALGGTPSIDEIFRTRVARNGVPASSGGTRPTSAPTRQVA